MSETSLTAPSAPALPAPTLLRFAAIAAVTFSCAALEFPVAGLRPFHATTVIFAACFLPFLRDPKPLLTGLALGLRSPLIGAAALLLALIGAGLLSRTPWPALVQTGERFALFVVLTLFVAIVGGGTLLVAARRGLGLYLVLLTASHAVWGVATNPAVHPRALEFNAEAGLGAAYLLLLLGDIRTLVDRSRRDRWHAAIVGVELACGLLAVPLLVFGHARTVMIASLAAVASLVVLERRAAGKLSVPPRIIALAAVAVGALALWRFRVGFVGDRLMLWHCIARRARAWWPHGLGIDAPVKLARWCGQDFATAGAHNFFLDAAVQGGVVAGALAVALMVAAIVAGLRTPAQGPRWSAARTPARLMVAYYAVLALFEPSLIAGPRAHLLVFVLSLAVLAQGAGAEARTSELSRSSEPPPPRAPRNTPAASPS